MSEQAQETITGLHTQELMIMNGSLRRPLLIHLLGPRRWRVLSGFVACSRREGATSRTLLLLLDPIRFILKTAKGLV